MEICSIFITPIPSLYQMNNVFKCVDKDISKLHHVCSNDMKEVDSLSFKDLPENKIQISL